MEEEAEHVVEHQLKDRTHLQVIICDLSRYPSPEAIIAPEAFAIHLQVALGAKQELQTRQRQLALACKDPVKEESPVLDRVLPAHKFPSFVRKPTVSFKSEMSDFPTPHSMLPLIPCFIFHADPEVKNIRLVFQILPGGL